MQVIENSIIRRDHLQNSESEFAHTQNIQTVDTIQAAIEHLV